jgi:D-threo-aldose 1-dehydrogenase
MRAVVLPGTDLRTSVLGLGTTGGNISEAERLRVYGVAFEEGITHFDTARGYGLGAAEGLVGRFIAGKRDRVTITTKLGMLPPSDGSLLRIARVMGRRVQKLAPSVGARAKQATASKMTAVGKFSVSEARGSLETSLRELGTDHVDILLLHECQPEDVTDELVAFMEEVVADGKARYTGTATGLASTTTILARGQTFPAVVQLANSVVEPLPDGMPSGRAVITHSSLSGMERVKGALERSPSMAESWAAQLGLAVTDLRILARLALRFAACDPARIVVFSSTNVEHIRENVASVEDPWMTDDEATRFARFVDLAQGL